MKKDGIIPVAEQDEQVQRALHERVSMILEGVHVHPGITEALPKDSDAIIVPLMMAVLDPATLKGRLRGRGKRAPGRRAKRCTMAQPRERKGDRSSAENPW